MFVSPVLIPSSTNRRGGSFLSYVISVAFARCVFLLHALRKIITQQIFYVFEAK